MHDSYSGSVISCQLCIACKALGIFPPYLGNILLLIAKSVVPLHQKITKSTTDKTTMVMKKIILSLIVLLTTAVSAKAMSYEQARDQALFLTDKMAYELDLSEQQYEAAFEINLDYLMSINNYDDVYSDYWTRRNLDLSYVLLDWQYRTFCGLDYFYRPLYWGDGFWHFRIYAHYPHRDYYYFGRPAFYATYRGAHAWHVHGSSWYYGRTFHSGGICMRGGWDRGGYRNISRGWRPGDGGHRGFDRGAMPVRRGGVTVRGGENRPADNRGSYNRGGVSRDSRPERGTQTDRGSYSRSERGSYGGGTRTEGRPSSTRTTVGGTRPEQSGSSYTPSRSFSGGTRGGSSSSFSGGTRGGSSSSYSGGTRGGSSFSGGSRGGGFSGASHSGGSFGGGSRGGSSSFSGGSHGGGHMGGRR